jgi:hypothetical protein
MIALFQDPALLIAIFASFLVGLLGYIIIRMWIKPIIRYHIIKHRLDGELTRYLDQLGADGERPASSHRLRNGSATLRTARQHAHELNSCYREALPYWYRLLLESRRTSPADAEGLLTNINKIKDPDQVAGRIANARKMAGMKPYR